MERSRFHGVVPDSQTTSYENLVRPFLVFTVIKFRQLRLPQINNKMTNEKAGVVKVFNKHHLVFLLSSHKYASKKKKN